MNGRALRSSLLACAAAALTFAFAFAFNLGTRAEDPKAGSRKVQKTDAEWRKQLPRDSYLVTRHADTEPAFTGKLLNVHAKGVFECIGCSSPLFSSKTKFDSGTGWPSFYAPFSKESVDTSTDDKLGYVRVEVLCNTCGAHLGHVFNDGPAPTGLRYCMNSVALKFETEAAFLAREKAARAEQEKAEKEKADKAAKDKVETKQAAR